MIEYPCNTPWGNADHIRTIAPGISEVGTPSHGGLHLEAALNAAMPACFRDHNAFTRRGWYEEDCEWAMVALVYREHFQEHADRARRTMERWFPDLLAKYDAEHATL